MKGVPVVGEKLELGPALVLSQPLPTVPLPPPYQLQEVAVPIVGNGVCNRQYQNFSSNDNDPAIKDDMLCAGSKGRNFCRVRCPCPLFPLCFPSP